MIRKFKNRTLPKGILIDNGYVIVRLFTGGRQFKKCIGPVTEIGIIDVAVAKLNQYREMIRLGKFDLEEKAQRLTMDEAIDVYWKLHGSKKKSAYTFDLHLKQIKKFFTGRYVDTISYVDVQNYRLSRERTVSPSSANREQTVITNLFNKLRQWRRLGIIRSVKLPEDNPGSLVKRANERAYARKRVVTPEEFQIFMRQAPESVQRICLGAINTTLRRIDLKNLKRSNVNEATNCLEGIQEKTGKPYRVPYQ